MDIFFRGSCRSIRSRVGELPESKECQCARRNIDVDVIEPQGLLETIKSTLLQILDVRLFRSLTFLAWTVGGASMAFGLFVPFTYVPKQSTILGYSKSKSSLLVSVIGVTNIIARIACGWLSDRPKIDVILVQNVSIFLGGVATIILPHLTDYWTLVIYCILFGLANACFSSLRSIVCVELLGLNNLTTATGWLFLFLGFANLLGSPVVAFVYDVTGNFKLSFYIIGGLMVFSAVLGFCWRRIKAWEKQRKRLCKKCAKILPVYY
ncbi:unnamed protein product [Soboliphyme baturini]|uniref:MFS domain-containing protein n=1 Tax=Soboliphyme baturini TaxID=241478 RepID=A0A183J0B1_9BILA|nr:unnamed protein product [Soboliphyme baturini]